MSIVIVVSLLAIVLFLASRRPVLFGIWAEPKGINYGQYGWVWSDVLSFNDARLAAKRMNAGNTYYQYSVRLKVR